MSGFRKRIKGLPTAVKVAAVICIFVLVGGIAVVIALLHRPIDAPPGAPTETVTEREASESVTTPVSDEEATEWAMETEEVPYFIPCVMDVIAFDKELSVYITNEEDQAIKGKEFSVKLIREEDYPSMETVVAAIAEWSSQIDQMAETLLDADYSAEAYQDLLRNKKAALDAYLLDLEEVEGTILTDDDADGVITADGLASGDYRICFLPYEEYDVSDYAKEVKITGSVSYQPLADIEKRMVSSAEAGDTKPDHSGIKVKSEKEDTVAYVESVTFGADSGYSEWKKIDPGVKATVSKEKSAQKTTEKNADPAAEPLTSKLTIPAGATLYANDAAAEIELKVTAYHIAEPTLAASDSIAKRISIREAEDKYIITLNQPNKITKDVTGTLTLSGTNVNGEQSKVTCELAIVGAGTLLKDEFGNQLYRKGADGKREKATVGNYEKGIKYCTKYDASTISYYGWQQMDGATYYYDSDGKRVTGVQVIRGIEYRFDKNGKLVSKGRGIDVSSWQGEIDWEQVSRAASFAIIRCGLRGTNGGVAQDSRAVTNVKAAQKNKMSTGLYFYSRARSEADAVEEASVAVKVAKEAGGIKLPIFINVEDVAMSDLDKGKRDAIVKAFAKTVKSAGYAAGVCATDSDLAKKLTPSDYEGISVWCIEYNTECTYEGDYKYWQYSAKGYVPGIIGDVNLTK